MTKQADRQRRKRRDFAAPGGSHDKLVRTLQMALPSLVGVLVAIMALAPLTPRGDVSFLLDKNKVALAENRFSVNNAMYRGRDDEGRPFSLKAGSAVQRSSSNPVVMMQELTARILLTGGTALLEAGKGEYDMASEKVLVDGPVRFSSEDGYRLVTRDVEVDLKERKMQSSGRVTGRVPAGTFSADRLRADLEERTVTLDGRARLTMQGQP